MTDVLAEKDCPGYSLVVLGDRIRRVFFIPDRDPVIDCFANVVATLDLALKGVGRIQGMLNGHIRPAGNVKPVF